MVITVQNLMGRDYVVIIDKSGSMADTSDCPNGKSRWEYAQESTFALAAKCEKLDPDGITLYVFSSSFKKYDNVTASKVNEVFAENSPCGGTNLAGVLKDALESYTSNKVRPVTILVVTDGEPDDQKAVAKVIVDATKKIDADEEIGISFIQVGRNLGATAFLKKLDDDLQSVGAKFDIVSTITMEDMENKTLEEVLLAAVND